MSDSADVGVITVGAEAGGPEVEAVGEKHAIGAGFRGGGGIVR